MDSNFRAEVETLHGFLAGWLGGALAREDAIFAPFAEALDAEFSMISPDGRQSARDEVVAAIRGAHGVRGGPDNDFKIWIENPRVIVPLPSHLTGVYEEWQTTAGITTARITTAVFRRDNSRPSGLRWRHIHETWLPEHAPPG